MTKKDTIRLLTVIQASYPNFKPDNLKDTIEAWSAILSDYDFDTISIALKRYIIGNASGFAPSIGQIIDAIPRRPEAEPLEAWAIVRKALRNSLYGAEEEFSKLPPEIQKAVGSAENLREMGQMNTAEVETVEQSHFIRAYRAVCERERHERMLPENLRIKAATEKPLQIGGLHDGN